MVQGLAEFNRRFEAIPKNVREAARDAMEKGADEIVQAMRATVRKRTRALEAAIKWTWGDAPAGSLAIGTVGGRSYGGLKITIYVDQPLAWRAWFLEAGTVKMPAYPFFFPIYRALKRRTRGRITRQITKAIRAS